MVRSYQNIWLERKNFLKERTLQQRNIREAMPEAYRTEEAVTLFCFLLVYQR